MTAGKMVAFEGIDASGKGTQAEFLARAAEARGLRVARFAFPRYSGSFYGELCVRYLAGEFGSVSDQSPYLSALPYAGDRLEAAPQLREALGRHDLVVVDRYVGSNAAHQGAKLPRGGFGEFAAWIRRLEYEVHGLPAEDAVVWLDVPLETVEGLMASRREATGRADDIHERDLAYLGEVRDRYAWLADRWPGWYEARCSEGGALRPVENIGEEIARHLTSELGLPLDP
jgi:dTMP kinase